MSQYAMPFFDSRTAGPMAHSRGKEKRRFPDLWTWARNIKSHALQGHWSRRTATRAIKSRQLKESILKDADHTFTRLATREQHVEEFAVTLSQRYRVDSLP